MCQSFLFMDAATVDSKENFWSSNLNEIKKKQKKVEAI